MLDIGNPRGRTGKARTGKDKGGTDKPEKDKAAKERGATAPPMPTRSEIGPTSEKRERLIRSLGERRPEPGQGPVDWDDLSLLTHGLAFAARPLHRATAAVTERHALGPRGAWILNLIDNGILYPHQIADVFQIGRSLVSSELFRLSEAGLIESRPGHDRRRTELTLTPAGQEALTQVRGGVERLLRASLAGYSPEEIRLCSQMLNDVLTYDRCAAEAEQADPEPQDPAER